MSELNDDQKRLADALEELKEHNFMRIHESAWKFLYYNLLRGLAIGLGSRTRESEGPEACRGPSECGAGP